MRKKVITSTETKKNKTGPRSSEEEEEREMSELFKSS